MKRSELDVHFRKIDVLVKEINLFVPMINDGTAPLRADLAGLLVVAMASTYESCVKEILYSYANEKHTAFGDFASRNFEKLNSRIKVKDLKDYCELFDPVIMIRFKQKLSARKTFFLDNAGKNIETSYEQILNWRHDFAHAWVRNTTIEEAIKTHRLGKRVLYTFADAFL